MMDCIAYWHNYWQGAVVKCGRPGLAGSVAEAQSHDKSVGGRSVTEIHGSVTQMQNKVQSRVWKTEWAQKCNGQHAFVVY